jgi:hypothetical protein
MPFEIEELQVKSDAVTEQIRVRKIFEVLKDKAINGKALTEHEKNFFCSCLKLSKLGDGKCEDYSSCDNFIFKEIYLTYFHDLTGGSAFHKIKAREIYKVDPNEAQRDLLYLYQLSEEWELIIQKTNHSNQLLQQISTETRNELKILSQLPEVINGFWRKGSNLYIFKERAILLNSKYIYCKALEIFEILKPAELILEINQTQIEFNEYSLIHILNRHYSETIKQYNTRKTFHNEDILPEILSIQLKDILKRIDETKLLQGKHIDHIGFKFKTIDYVIWTSVRTKSTKGENIDYRRLDTFYPIINETEKNKLNSNYNLAKIDETLSVYVPK